MPERAGFGAKGLRTPSAPGATSLIIEVGIAEALAEPFRQQHDPVAPSGMPAHITVLWPFIRREELDASALAALREFIGTMPAFDFVLERLGEFSGVLYLAPDPEEPFVALTRALWDRYPAYPPFAGMHADIVPHLTIAHTEDTELLAAIREEVEAELAMIGTVSCRAEAITLMEERDGIWSRREVFPLSGG